MTKPQTETAASHPPLFAGMFGTQQTRSSANSPAEMDCDRFEDLYASPCTCKRPEGSPLNCTLAKTSA